MELQPSHAKQVRSAVPTGSRDGDGHAVGRELRVFLLTSNEVLSCGLEAVLSGLPMVDSVRRSASATEAAAALGPGRFDVLILPADDAESLEQIPETLPSATTKVLILIDDSYAEHLSDFGNLRVSGFLMQHDLSSSSLAEALKRAMAGEMVMPAHLGDALLAKVSSHARQTSMPNIVLTDRERETLLLLAEGLSNQEIARRLRVSSHGSKRLVARVLLKLGSPNRTSAVVTAIRYGMIDAM